MEKNRGNNNFRYTVLLASSVFLLFISFVISLCVGRYDISFIDCISVILKNDSSSVDNYKMISNIIFRLRLPRTIAAMLIGISLASSGSVYQSTFNNRLVSPDILGVSSGSCIGAALSIIVGFSSNTTVLFAFCSGIATVSIALLIPKLIHNTSNLTLILSGVVINSFSNSIIGLLKYIADPQRQLSEITFWMMGSIAGVKLNELYYLVISTSVCSFILLLLSWRINIISLGEENSKSLGVNFKRLRLIIIIASTMLTASTVCVAGSIGWIGLIVPHISRFIVGEDNRKNLPLTITIGGIFMIIVDMLARSLSKNEIPLSIITGFIGTPIYILLLAKRGVKENRQS